MNMLEQIAKFLRTIFVGTVSGGWVRPAQMGSPKWKLASGARVQMPALQNHPIFPKIEKLNVCLRWAKHCDWKARISQHKTVEVIVVVWTDRFCCISFIFVL